MIAITPRLQRRGLALVILAVAIAIVWAVVIRPLADIFGGDSEDVRRSLKLLASYQALVAARPQVEAELRAMQQRSASASGLVEGNTSAVAAAKLQSDVKAIVENNGGSVLSSQNLPPTAADEFEKIEVQYDITLPLGGLRNLIYQIETHTPYFFIDNVNMRVPENWQPQSSSTPTPKLEVQWTVRGYRWVGKR